MLIKKFHLQVILMIVIFIMILTQITKTNYNYYLNVEFRENLTNVPANRIKTVLFWTTFFQDTRWTLGNDTIYMECPLAACVYTNKRDYLDTVDMYDAVVFHAARRFSKTYPIPHVRRAQQLYVFASLESPPHTQHELEYERDFYNLTMSYRLDSDIVWSYAQVLDRKTNGVVAPAMNPNWRSVNASWLENDEDLMNVISAKKKYIAWFVSNCKSSSKREHFVKQLQKYASVDIFGACGEFSCPRYSNVCDEMLDNDYKFYLSFENSLCMDYVTEKLFDILNRNIIPIVYGRANYTKFAPPHSYIDAQSFKNLRELTDYLKYLDENPKEYAKYFWWRKYYKISSRQLKFPSCDLCHHISKKSIEYRRQSYYDIESYWRSNACIYESKIDFYS